MKPCKYTCTNLNSKSSVLGSLTEQTHCGDPMGSLLMRTPMFGSQQPNSATLPTTVTGWSLWTINVAVPVKNIF